MPVPNPTPILRFLHIDNLHICLRRVGLHAPNFTPEDGLYYRTIHNLDIQSQRQTRRILCGPRGVIHDYVPFYFGQRSPMLLQLHTRHHKKDRPGGIRRHISRNGHRPPYILKYRDNCRQELRPNPGN